MEAKSYLARVFLDAKNATHTEHKKMNKHCYEREIIHLFKIQKVII